MGFVHELARAFETLDTSTNCGTKAFVLACEAMLPIFDYLGRWYRD